MFSISPAWRARRIGCPGQAVVGGQHAGCVAGQVRAHIALVVVERGEQHVLLGVMQRVERVRERDAVLGGQREQAEAVAGLVRGRRARDVPAVRAGDPVLVDHALGLRVDLRASEVGRDLGSVCVQDAAGGAEIR
jgi:hypothetical protein